MDKMVDTKIAFDAKTESPSYFSENTTVFAAAGIPMSTTETTKGIPWIPISLKAKSVTKGSKISLRNVT